MTTRRRALFPPLLQLFAALLCALFMTSAADAASAASAAAASNPAGPVSLTPAQANTALHVLNDPAQRARVEDTLRAIAAAGALATPASAASASEPGAASAATPASAPLANALRSNGLVLLMAHHAAHSAKIIGARLLHTRTALFNLGSAREWWTQRLSTPAGHAMLLGLLRVLLLTLGPALILEAIVRRLIRRPHRAIIEYASRPRGTRTTAAPARPDAPPARAASAAAAERDAKARDAQEEALRKAAGMEPDDQSSPAHGDPNAGPNANAEANEAARAAATTPQPGDGTAPAGAPGAPATTSRAAARAQAVNERTAHHWSRLQRLPAALLLAVLNLLPVIAFGVCTAGILSLFGPDDVPYAAAVGQLVDTYVICRIVIAVGALLFAPDAEALRMFPLTNSSAAFAQRWTTRIVVIGGIGGALNAAVDLGMTEDAHLALIKVVTLVGHLALAVMIVQCRRTVSAAITARATGRSTLAYLARWFAEIWAGFAVFVVMALWFVWALDVRGGYSELVRAGGLSLLALLAARLVAIVALGALGRVFDPLRQRTDITIAQRRAYRYYPALRRVVTVVIWLATIDVVLLVWGVHLGRLLLSAAVGHLLGSALLTVLVAVVIAVVIWEAANGAAERRLHDWTEAGDYVRAARLRTLLPMFRTTLLVAIVVIVGLTALSQLGINTAPLIAGASIFGVALGFGSQKLVQDFITGIFLLTENAMQVGDWVTVAGVSGTVEFLSIRTVRLRGGDGSLYTVPFSSVTTVNNTNRGIGNAAVKVVIAYGEDVERAVQTLKEIGAELRADDQFKDGIKSDFSYWGVDQVDGANVTLVGQIQCSDTARWPVQREFNRRVLERFTQRGITLANPQRNFVVSAPRAADVEGHEAPDDDHGDDSRPTRGRAQDPKSANGRSGDGHAAASDERKPS